jgi:hypothetical protein
MEAFYVLGSALAVSALIAAFLGITRKDFPGSPRLERLVGAFFAALVIAAIGAAIVGALNEDESEEPAGGEHAALVPSR